MDPTTRRPATSVTLAAATRVGLRRFAVALALLAAVVIAPPWAPEGAGPTLAQSTRGRATSTPAPRFAVDLAAAIAADPAGIAARLPAWAEAIEAGQTDLSLSETSVAALRKAGVQLKVRGSAPAALAAWPACVSRLDEHLAWARERATERPDLLRLIDIGDSWCKQAGGCVTPGRDRLAGDDLLVLRVSAVADDAAVAGRMFIDGGLHARELASTELMASFVDEMLRGYGVDPQVTWLLDHRAIYVGLASNPDGRRLVELGTREDYGGEPWYVRKNARDEGGGRCAWPPQIGEHLGVDLNRNHAFAFDAPGHSRQPCGETYRGSAPASEPEIRAYEDFLRSIMPDQRGPADTDAAPRDTTGLLINFHSFTSAGTVLVPWGWTSEKAPNDPGLSAIARRYAERVGYEWRYSLYPVSGNTRDWAYGELGVPAYVIELQGEDFFPTCARLPGRLRAQQPGLSLAAAISDRPYARIRGPEVRELVVERVAGEGGWALRVAAVADDTAFAGGGAPGGDEGDGPAAVAGAEVLVGRYGYAASGRNAGGDGSAAPSGDAAGAGGSARSAGSVAQALARSAAQPAAMQAPPRADRARGEGRPLDALDGAFGGATEALTATLDIAGLAPGRWYAVVRARDANGSWGPPAIAPFTVDGPTWTPGPPATAIPAASTTPTATRMPSPSASTTPTATRTPSPSATSTPTASTTPTATPPPIPDATTSPAPSATVEPSGTPQPSGTPSAVAPRARIHLPFLLDRH